jgi:4-alpha-glucanotransferase
MVVLEFAFSEGLKGPQRPGGNETDRVTNTGTHDDDDTSVGWWNMRPRPSARPAAARIDEHPALLGADRACARLACSALLITAEDLLGLGSQGRMNTPGKTDGNRGWWLAPGELSDDLARRIRELTVAPQRVDRKRP